MILVKGRPGALLIEQAREINRTLPYGPLSEPCACGAGRHEHSGRTNGGRCARTGCQRYRLHKAWELAAAAHDARDIGMTETLRRFDGLMRSKRKRSGKTGVSASDVGTCRKKIEFRENPPEDLYRNITDGRAARMGSLLHDGFEIRRQKLFPWRRFEQSISIPGLDRNARYDEYDPITGKVIDWKTAGTWQWDQVGERGPSDDWIDQVLLYCLALEMDGEYVAEYEIVAVERAGGADAVFTYPWTDDARSAAQIVLDGLLDTMQSLDLGLPLPRDRSGPSSDVLCARFCEFRDYCWNLPQATAAGRSGESYTVLGAEPETEMVEWAGLNLLEKRKAKRAADDAEKQAKALVDGVDAGTYGKVKIVTKFSTSASWKDHAEYLLEVMDLPPDQRPAKDTLKQAPSKRKPYTTVEPVAQVKLPAQQRRTPKSLLAAEEKLAAETLRVDAVRADEPAALPAGPAADHYDLDEPFAILPATPESSS